MIASRAFKLRCHKNSIRLLQSVDAGATSTYIDGSFDAPTMVTNGRVEIAEQDRVGVQTSAERNKISFSRHWSRTGALTGSESLGICCERQSHGQYASHRK